MSKARDIASAAPAPSTVSATELGYLDGVTSAIQTQLDAKTAKSTLTTTGDIYYASAADTPARLGIGSTGNVLTVAAGVPSWAAPAGGGGKVLQVVNATYSTSTTIATTNFTDTGITATITPSLASSKILVLVTASVYSSRSSSSKTYWASKLLRGATTLFTYTGGQNLNLSSGGWENVTFFVVPYNIHYLDSPNTTSATTYKIQGNHDENGVTTVWNNSQPSSITLLEIGA
jgi:hypothetical protein